MSFTVFLGNLPVWVTADDIKQWLAAEDLVADAGYLTACTTEFGVNKPGDSPLALKRITARYPSRNLGNLKLWFAQKFLKAPRQSKL